MQTFPFLTGKGTADKKFSLEDTKKSLELNSDLNVKEIRERLRFEDAIKKGNEKTTLEFLKKFPEYAKIFRKENGNNTLHFAVKALHNHLNKNKNADPSAAILILKALIEGGADINKQNINGDTPLHEAIKLGNLPLIIYLIKEGADISLANYNEETLLHLAAAHANPAIMAAIFLTTDYSQVDKIDWEAKNTEGKTPYEIATENGNLEVRRFIVDQNLDTLNKKKELDSDSESKLTHCEQRNLKFKEVGQVFLSDKLYTLAQKDPQRFRLGFTEFTEKTALVKEQQKGFQKLLDMVADNIHFDPKIHIQLWLAQYLNWKDIFTNLAKPSEEEDVNISLDSMAVLLFPENDQKSYEFRVLSSNNFEENIIQLFRKYLGNEVFDEIFVQSQNFQNTENQEFEGKEEAELTSNFEDELKQREERTIISPELFDFDYKTMAREILINPEVVKDYGLNSFVTTMIWEHNFNQLAVACEEAEKTYEEKRGKERPIKLELDKIKSSTKMTIREKYIALAGLILAKVREKSKKHKEQLHQQAQKTIGLDTESHEERIFKPIIEQYIPTAIHDECIEAYNGYLNGTLYFRPVVNLYHDYNSEDFKEEIEKQNAFIMWLQTNGQFANSKDNLGMEADRKFFLEDKIIEEKTSKKVPYFERLAYTQMFKKELNIKAFPINSLNLLVEGKDSQFPGLTNLIHQYAFYQLIRQLPQENKNGYGENTVILQDNQLSNLINYFIVNETSWEARNLALLGYIFLHSPVEQQSSEKEKEKGKEKGKSSGGFFGAIHSIKEKSKETRDSLLSSLKLESEKKEENITSPDYTEALAYFNKIFKAANGKNDALPTFKIKCITAYQEYEKLLEAGVSKEVKSIGKYK